MEGPRCESQARGAGCQAEPLSRRTGVSLQLKEKHKQSGGGLGALEELENAFSLAEESCPGISDKLMAQLVERVQRCGCWGGGGGPGRALGARARDRAGGGTGPHWLRSASRSPHPGWHSRAAAAVTGCLVCRFSHSRNHLTSAR